MHNPYLVNTLQSQGLRYLLADSGEQKKALAAAPQKILSAKDLPQKDLRPKDLPPERLYQPVQNSGQSSAQNAGQSPAEQFKASTSPKENPYKGKFQPLLKEKKSKKEPEIISAFDKNPLKQPILPYEKWCPEWEKIRQHCKFSSEKPQYLSRQIIWTYADLEYDLFTGNPSAERRQLISQIIKTLALPKGTHIFLPYRIINAAGKSEIAEDKGYSFFWSAVDLIRPRVLVVFGGQTISELGLPPLLPTTKYTLMPVTVYALDNIMLYTENESENAVIMNFLSANLKIFA